MFSLTNLHIYITHVTLNHTILLLLKEKKNLNWLSPTNTCFLYCTCFKSTRMHVSQQLLRLQQPAQCTLMAPDGPRETAFKSQMSADTHTHQHHDVRGDFHRLHPDTRTFMISTQKYSVCPTGADRKTRTYACTIQSLSLSLTHTHTRTLVHCTSTKMSHYCTNT